MEITVQRGDFCEIVHMDAFLRVSLLDMVLSWIINYLII